MIGQINCNFCHSETTIIDDDHHQYFAKVTCFTTVYLHTTPYHPQSNGDFDTYEDLSILLKLGTYICSLVETNNHAEEHVLSIVRNDGSGESSR